MCVDWSGVGLHRVSAVYGCCLLHRSFKERMCYKLGDCMRYRLGVVSCHAVYLVV